MVLVAEVLSESTRQIDLRFKRALYQREGVPIYLVIDTESEAIQMHHNTADGNYQAQELTGDLFLRICEDCEIKVTRSSIFGR